MNIKTIFLSLIALITGVTILLFLDESTLFLAALLLSVVVFKTTKKEFDTLVGLWFALSVAPAYGIIPQEITNLANGFLVQVVSSYLFFLLFYYYKPSIIGRLYNNSKGNIGVVIASILCGFAAGIMSSLLWQGYLQLQM